jgi:hypothetical protein
MRSGSRIYIDQHQACQRTTELEHHPFDAIRRPDTDALPWSQTEGAESGRGSPYLAGILGPGETNVLFPIHHGKPLAQAGSVFEKHRADRSSNDGTRRAARITFH